MKYFHTQRSVKLSLDTGNEFCHSVYHFFFVLSRVSSKTCHVSSSANYCIQTADLWFWKQLLCQLSPNYHHLHFLAKNSKWKVENDCRWFKSHLVWEIAHVNGPFLSGRDLLGPAERRLHEVLSLHRPHVREGGSEAGTIFAIKFCDFVREQRHDSCWSGKPLMTSASGVALLRGSSLTL